MEVLAYTIMNAVQAYIRELRMLRKVSQEDLADSIGLSRRALIDWESGKTEGIKDGPLFKAVDTLRAGLHHIYYLATHTNVSVDDAVRLARAWIEGDDLLSSDAAAFVLDIQKQGKVAEALDIIQRLEELDPASLDRLLGYGQSLLDQQR